MEGDDVKRGRGRGRPIRARGRGRGRPRKKPEEIEESQTTVVAQIQANQNSEQSDLEKENEIVPDSQPKIVEQSVPDKPEIAPEPQIAPLLPALTMEADISQLEAPTFTTITPRVPESMLSLQWNHKVNLIGTKREGLVLHLCDVCRKPILQYGRMIPCKHVFCATCAAIEPNKTCKRCNEAVQRIEETTNVFMCMHGGTRYGTDGCRRTYLSQRDLQAHINHRHVTQPAPVLHQQQQQPQTGGSNDSGILEKRRKHSESTSGLGPMPTSHVHATHSSLTQANLARINSANEQDCQQGRASLQQTLKKATHLQSESVADASYYSSVLNSFGSGGQGAQGGYESTRPPPTAASTSNSWQSSQFYR